MCAHGREMRLQTLVLDLASNSVLNLASIVTPTLARKSALNQEAQGAGAPRWGESGEALPPQVRSEKACRRSRHAAEKVCLDSGFSRRNKIETARCGYCCRSCCCFCCFCWCPCLHHRFSKFRSSDGRNFGAIEVSGSKIN